MDEYCGYDVEDVHGGTELDEVMCEACGMIQPATNKFCSHCGEDFKKGKARDISIDERRLSMQYTKFITFVITIVVFMALYFITEAIEAFKEKENDNDGKFIIEIPEYSHARNVLPENSSLDIPKSKAQTDRENKKSTNDDDNSDVFYPEGEYVVGEDIPEGEYIVISDNFGNDYIENLPYFVVNDGEMNLSTYFFNSFYNYFETGYILETNSCTLYPVGSCPVNNTPFENQGMFKVGVDIKAGKYSVVPMDCEIDGSYWIFDSLEDYHEMGYLVESGGVPESGAEIELKEGQYLQLDFCSLE